MVEQEATEEEKKLMQTIYERYDLEDEWALEQLRAHVQCEVEKRESIRIGKGFEEWYSVMAGPAEFFTGKNETAKIAAKFAWEEATKREQQAVDKKADHFLEALNHIVYTGSQDIPIYKTEAMKAKTEMAKTIREIFVKAFDIPKEKIENYTPPEEFEVDGVDVDERR